MITVYFWAPDMSAKNIGHISLTIGTGQAKGLERYVSWWPGHGDKKWLVGKPISSRTYEGDVKAEGGPPTATVSISGLDEAKMKRAWENMLANNPRYLVYRKNCAWTVKSILDVGTGYDLMSAHLDFINLRLTGGVWTPRTVFEYAKLLKHRYNSNAQRSAQVPSDAYGLRLS
ncbi:hypothetical protein [Agrobacterium rubi]|uniref:Uncharacterized protein n=1 Tax=Agrobacterium rubi TaxID=28099 RepID=A0AAE7QZT1_9HYPH|nr:hypothetical protein [Agrobacterium rubi]NTE87038.1 hypothetical protein [Agrobacterium rubi]NTF02972.1 hypothetical protein [Agrobacterium rubi]NTF37216.1 hypothetical protein [Agrobacterium rubi]QTF99642.1 hypothetical protein G6M88_04135 [Agrobacterium rubi]